MIKFLYIIFVGCIPIFTNAQIRVTGSSFQTGTLNSNFVRKHPPSLYSFPLKHRGKGTLKKIARGSLYVTGYNISMGGCLLLCPEYISKWNKKEKFQVESIANQYHKSFTSHPVIDRDLWMVNYIGHPYQGGFYYNSIRSQDATAWQSALFCVGHSLVWEYGWEGGMEQPSIQDMITTPLCGILVGEISHVATIKMSRNGFRWYEVLFVCLINPAFAFNHRFRFNPSRNP